MDMEEEIRKLREQLRAADERADAADERADAADERVQRAERAAERALPQNLEGFLLGCHELYRMVKSVTDPKIGTTGVLTNPIHRLVPERIVLWEDFGQRQQEKWRRLNSNQSLWTDKLYTPAVALDAFGRRIDPIASEDELRYVERLTVEDNVKLIFESMYLGEAVNGKISFENQARFREDGMEDLPKRIAASSGSENYPRNIRADQFCVFRQTGEVPIPLVAIEYKAPHKLTTEIICTGLESDIWPERDVINKHSDEFNFRCKDLMAAVVTQLFSYMIDRGVQYGYITTGEAFIFGCIPEEATSFRYSVNIPREDCVADNENHLQRTAVAQVFAFIWQALRSPQPAAVWSDRARANLKRWPVEFIDVLATIPITERKSREASEYKPIKWSTIPKVRRRYKLRNRCNDSSPGTPTEDDDRDDDPDDDPAGADSPTQLIAARNRPAASRNSQSEASQPHKPSQHRKKATETGQMHIEKRPYCTHRCLQGLCEGGPVDPSCPNADDHGGQHISKDRFLGLLQQRNINNRVHDAEWWPLWIYGSRGALYKVRLSTYGYTVVAKGMESGLQQIIAHEYKIYQHLHSLQAHIIPVCCGLIHLDKPLFFDGVPLNYFLILSFAGTSVAALHSAGKLPEQLQKRTDDEGRMGIQKIRALGVKHGDEAERNVLYDSRTDTCMIIDFERSTFVDRVLKPLSPNRKRTSMPPVHTGKRCRDSGLGSSGEAF